MFQMCEMEHRLKDLGKTWKKTATKMEENSEAVLKRTNGIAEGVQVRFPLLYTHLYRPELRPSYVYTVFYTLSAIKRCAT